MKLQWKEKGTKTKVKSHQNLHSQKPKNRKNKKTEETIW